jgi:hypothetical protein
MCAFQVALDYMNDKAIAEHHAPMVVTEQKLVKRWKDY